jgi:hypothetical protein
MVVHVCLIPNSADHVVLDCQPLDALYGDLFLHTNQLHGAMFFIFKALWLIALTSNHHIRLYLFS